MLDTMPRRSRVEEPTTALTLRLPSELLERLRQVSDEQDRSLNAQVVRALREWLERYPPEGTRRMNSRRLSRKAAQQLADLRSALIAAQTSSENDSVAALREALHAATLLGQQIDTELTAGVPGSFDQDDRKAVNTIVGDIARLMEKPGDAEIEELLERVERLSR